MAVQFDKLRVTSFDFVVESLNKKVTLMLYTNNPIIKHKACLLNLAEELGNVSRACGLRRRWYAN